jgi:protein associated with RNAse G/E
VRYVDLQLDVRVLADVAGVPEYWVVDEDEFEAAQERYAYGERAGDAGSGGLTILCLYA